MLYLSLLREKASEHGLRVLAYCLMSNHIHLVATPERPDSLAQALGRTHCRYAQCLNALEGRTGHFWQNRFFSCPLDEPHLWVAINYVERNPVRGGLVRRAAQWPWSSAQAHLTGEDPSRLLDMAWWRAQGPRDWQEALAEPPNPERALELWQCTHTGRPFGSDQFLADLERQTGRRLRPLPGGRPKRGSLEGQLVLEAVGSG